MRKTLITILIVAVAILVPDAAAGVDGDAHDSTDASSSAYTAAEERRIEKHVRLLGRRWEAAPPLQATSRALADLGTGRRRDMNVALFELHRHEDPFLIARDIADDPLVVDEVADTVLSSFLKLEREALEDALGFDTWFSRKKSRIRGDRGDDRAGGLPARSFRMRVSPQLDAGNGGKVGVKLKLPYLRNDFFDHFSLRLEQELETGDVEYALKFDDGNRFYYLEAVPGSQDLGDRVAVGIRFWF